MEFFQVPEPKWAVRNPIYRHISSYFRHIPSWGHVIDFLEEISQKFSKSLKKSGMGVFGIFEFCVLCKPGGKT